VVGNAPLIIRYSWAELVGTSAVNRTFTGFTGKPLDATQLANAGLTPGTTLEIAPQPTKTGKDGDSFDITATLSAKNPDANDLVKITVTDSQLAADAVFYVGNGKPTATKPVQVTFAGHDIDLTDATIKVEKVENATPVLEKVEYVVKGGSGQPAVNDEIRLTFSNNVELDETNIASGTFTFTDTSGGGQPAVHATDATVNDNVVTIKIETYKVEQGDTMLIPINKIVTTSGASNKANITVTFNNLPASVSQNDILVQG